MELIHIHNLEAPTGIEIIKRLLKNKLVSEFTDPEDKRAKRIKITCSGSKELQKIDPEITKEFKEFGANIELSEKIYLVGILTKLMNI
jgi:DNA-binding MarR family transcriptional regulator